MPTKTWKEWDKLDEYCQDELPCVVLEEVNPPEGAVLMDWVDSEGSDGPDDEVQDWPLQDEPSCSVLIEDNLPEMVTLWAVCECGRVIYKATASNHSRAWNTIKRQVKTGKCIVCTSRTGAETSPYVRHSSVTRGRNVVRRKIVRTLGIGG
jgi:hypothetical protein